MNNKIKRTSHRRLLIYAIILIIGSGSTISASAQSTKGLGKYGASFLQISSSARQAAMGDAFTGLADDVNFLRYNIGGLGNINKAMLAINFHKWINDTHQGDIGFAVPTQFGMIGFNFTYFNEGKVTKLNQDFVASGTEASSNDIALTLGYGSYFNLFRTKISLGGGLKIVRQNLADKSATAMGLDLGILASRRYLSYGITIQNLGITKLKFIDREDDLPETYRTGVGLHFPIGKYIQVNMDADIAYLREQKLRAYFGSEIVINNLIAIRGGYKFHDFEVNRWGAGLGLVIPMEWLANSETRLDFAYTPMDAFDGSTQRFSLIFRFGVSVPTPVTTLMVPDERKLAEINEQLKKQLEAAEKARLAAEEAEMRTRALEDTMRARLERIKQIASESGGKIEVEEQSPTPGKVSDKILVSMRINFDFDKANIRPEEYPTMDRVGEILNTYPESQMLISGHTDYIGTDEYNIKLSQRRIDSVMTFLTKREHVDYNRFYNPIGYGELKPIADNSTDEGRFRNRRVEFLIYTRDAKPEMPEASAIKTIEVVDNQTVRIVGNGKVTKFTHDLLDEPYRLVIDFPYIFLLTDRTSYDIYKGPFIRARLGYHPEEIFSRVVFDLFELMRYDIETVENLVIIHVK